MAKLAAKQFIYIINKARGRMDEFGFGDEWDGDIRRCNL
jgi:hypothetical protein